MMTNNLPEIGIVASRDLSLTIDWRSFAAEMSGACVSFWTGEIAGGASSTVEALVKAALSIKKKHSNGEKVWLLTAYSFGWSMNHVFKNGHFEIENVKDVINAVIMDVSDRSDDVMVPGYYLDNPNTLPLYISMRAAVLDNINVIYPRERRNDIEFRLDAAFNRAVYEIWSKNSDFYQSIFEALNIPFTDSARRSVEWEAYRKEMVYNFEIKPIFGQEENNIPLSSLYAPLRGYWKTGKADDVDFLRPIGRAPVEIIDEALDKWVVNSQSDDWLRLIGGGPGSGKSTTLKAFARRIADNYALRPLFIPLQHINLTIDLREAINKFFTERTDSPFVSSPLSRDSIEQGAPLVLIFDGLDEIAMPGDSASDIVNMFANRLNALVSALVGDKRDSIRVVVSGRMPAFQSAKRFLTPEPHGCIEAYGFLPASDDDRASDLWLVDQRPQWWTQYSLATGASSDLPPAFSTTRLEGITHEPLLCYLLALAGYATEHWEEAADNRNRIYAALMKSIYHRVWGEGAQKRLGQGRSLTHTNFDKLMETIALAAWLGGDARIASVVKFEEALELTGSKAAWEQFKEDSGSDVNNLAMNFYLKASEKDQRGFEFTHKSFGEYLAAKALLSISLEASSLADRKLDHAITDWFNATRTGSSTLPILFFCRDEARLVIKETLDGIKSVGHIKATFEKIINRTMEEGFPIAAITGASVRSISSENVNAEASAWMILNSCSRALAESDLTELAVIRLDLKSPVSMMKIIAKSNLSYGTNVVSMCLNNIIANEQHFYSLSSFNMDVGGSDLSACTFSRCDFYSGYFSFANLKNSRFYNCGIMSGDFEGAKIDGVRFYDCEISDVSFELSDFEMISMNEKTILLSNLDVFNKIESKILLHRDIDEAESNVTSFEKIELAKHFADKLAIYTE